MKLVLVVPDNLCMIDNVAQYFDYRDLLSTVVYGDKLHAVQWTEIYGQKELFASVQDPDNPEEQTTHINIDSIDEFQPIIDRYESNKTTVKNAVQTELYEVEIEYLSGEFTKISYDDAVNSSLDFTLMPLEDAKAEKVAEARANAIQITNDLFNNRDVLAQINSRTMMNQRWNSLNSKETLTPEEEAEIATFNDVFIYLENIDAEFAANEDAINLLTTVDEVVNYVIEYNTPLPSTINSSNPAIQFIRKRRA